MKSTLKAVGAACALAQAVFATLAHSADNALVQRGAYLANTVSNGKPFAGGFKMLTPMGAIYSTNVTPDPDTGIGHYSEADFARAMREGVAKDGHNLYPAMPYPSYVKTTDSDIHALYTYFMNGVAPVKQPNRKSDIKWPMNMRWPLKFWNMVFLEKGAYQDKSGKDVAWNRGAYLVQGLGHCGSCHTPRGIAFQEKALDESGSAYLTGGPVDNWFASNLTGDHNVGLGRWSGADIAQFLKTGANQHASAFGSMTSVINNSSQAMTEADLGAISQYLKSLSATGGNGGPPYSFDPKLTKVSLARPANDAGARVYTTYCMHCHGVEGRGVAPMLAPLAGNPNVLQKSALSLINVTLNGTEDIVLDGIPAPFPMPNYAPVLNNKEIADVLTFIRSGWNNAAPAVTADEVAKLRKEAHAAR
jgi:alcohol dehydrogenase (quinone), cytochrome c subunit